MAETKIFPVGGVADARVHYYNAALVTMRITTYILDAVKSVRDSTCVQISVLSFNLKAYSTEYLQVHLHWKFENIYRFKM